MMGEDDAGDDDDDDDDDDIGILLNTMLRSANSRSSPRFAWSADAVERHAGCQNAMHGSVTRIRSNKYSSTTALCR